VQFKITVSKNTDLWFTENRKSDGRGSVTGASSTIDKRSGSLAAKKLRVRKR
jgi:hypothetical protein